MLAKGNISMNIYSRNNLPPGFYVYAYIRSKNSVIAKAGPPYYIGKGTGDRAYNRNGHRLYPPNDSYVVILETNLTNLGAQALERRMIRWYGRVNLGTGILRNLTDGGDGGHGLKVITPESKRKKCRERMIREHKNPKSIYKSKELLLKKSNSMKSLRANKTTDSKFNTPEYKIKVRESCKKGAEKYKKWYRVISPTGEVYIIHGLKDFCQTHNLHKSGLAAVARGNWKSYKGWTGTIIEGPLIKQ